jgi:tetratricopeptide (TPR) repeat protein
MPQARLRALQQILRTLVEHPEPRALVVACTDHETFYVVHLLDQLDEQSAADRFCVLADPCKNVEDYVGLLETVAQNAIDLPIPRSCDPTPASRLLALLDHLLADLPPGQHRLVVALVPAEIHDPPGFSALVEALLAAPLDPRLRLVLRDDRVDPRHFTRAAQSSSEQLFAYTFALPPELLLADLVATTHDRTRAPDERALALIQLACQDLGHGRHDDALARCAAASRLPACPALQALALAIQADALRRVGDSDAALSAGVAALRLAVETHALPIVQHAALALGDLTRELGRLTEAAACFGLAERAASFNPEVSAHARALRSALPETPC